MKIKSLTAKIIAPVLLLLPMTCMHTVDDPGSGGHGGHHSLSPKPSFESGTQSQVSGNVMGMEGITVVAQYSKGGD